MTQPDAPLDDVAAAILDGAPVDWATLDGRLGESDPLLIEQLKTLAVVRAVARAPEALEERVPETWGHLRVLERIGSGAFGQVHRAWDTRLDREVALKLLPVDAAGRSGGSSIIEEGRLLARVRHPNVVTIHGAERIGDDIGLWMEFVKGQTLEDLLRAGKRFTPAEAAGIGVELCAAVAAVHAAGLLHRDIKAQNVVVAEDGRIVLMDFGTGHDRQSAAEANATGTPLYLAPEILSGSPATIPSDVYSIGVLLYHLLTGSFPVRARDLQELRRAHAEGRRTAVRTERPDVPHRLVRVLDRAIDPAAERRFQSASELGQALASLRGASLMRRTAYAATVAAAVVALVLLGRGPVSAPAGPGNSPGASLAAAVLPAPEAPVIAVLPFKNRSSEPDTDYFVDGLTVEVIRSLAVIDGLQVRSQTSSFFFKDRPRNLGEVGEQLHANLVIEGSVQREGRRLRINVLLARVAGDVVLWSETFDRPLADVFAIQDEISRAIVNRLRLTLGRGERRHQPNVEAYDLYLRARAVVDRRGTESASQAAALFEQAIEKDPAYAAAYAGLVDAYLFMSMELRGPSGRHNALLPAEALLRMRPAAERALELDPLLAEAHAAMGMTFSRECDWNAADREFLRAIELNPSLTQTYTNYSISTLVPLGRLEEAERYLNAALTNDPLSLAVRREIAHVQMRAGRHGEAIAILQHVLTIDREFPFVDLLLAQALTASGRLDEAWPIWESRKHEPGWHFHMARAYVLSGRRAEAERMLTMHEHPLRRAAIHAALGDKERTIEALSAAADITPHRVALMLAGPGMEFLRGDPRLEPVRKRLKLP